MDFEKMKLSDMLYEAADQLAYDGNLWNILHKKAMDLEYQPEKAQAFPLTVDEIMGDDPMDEQIIMHYGLSVPPSPKEKLVIQAYHDARDAIRRRITSKH